MKGSGYSRILQLESNYGWTSLALADHGLVGGVRRDAECLRAPDRKRRIWRHGGLRNQRFRLRLSERGNLRRRRNVRVRVRRRARLRVRRNRAVLRR